MGSSSFFLLLGLELVAVVLTLGSQPKMTPGCARNARIRLCDRSRTAILFRHVTAFALAGWYLLAPPIPSTTSTAGTERRLLSNWVRIGTFDTREQCSEGRLNLIHGGKGGSDLAGSEAEVKKALHSSRCIASDDRR